MEKHKTVSSIIGAAITVVGVILVCITRGSALADGAAAGQTVPFAVGLIMVPAGIMMAVMALLPRREPVKVRTLSMAALFAALCYIGFTYCKIDIPVGAEKTAFHLGNVFCVMAALLIGGFWGGMSGAIGMTIADLTTAYVTSAPKTFLLKLCIGCITGFVAHKVFHLSQERERKVSVPVAAAISCSAGMGFNMVADPLVGYFYKMYILGVPQEAANVWAKIGAITTSVNALVAIAAATVLYIAIRPALLRSNLLPRL